MQVFAQAHANRIAANKVRAVRLAVTSYQAFTHVEVEGRAVCIPGPLPCRLPVNQSMSRLTEAALNTVE